MSKLVFFKNSINSCVTEIQKIATAESRVVFHKWDDFALDVSQSLGDGYQVSIIKEAEVNVPLKGMGTVSELSINDLYVINESDADKLSSTLINFIDSKHLTILAPVTENYFQNRPLFLISIPKGGTHLLYKLAEAVGYNPGVVHKGEPKPGTWYCVEYSNSHTVAKDFFIDTVRRQPFGNRHHSFPRTPTLFIYRNPLDIVVSEANYYHRDGATVFSSYLRQHDFNTRLLHLIDDPYLLGSIRDRINNFVPWLNFENVIPVSFEELIGSKGGGDDLVRTRLIWSLQLKLHIPGDPEQLGALIFDEASPTFHEGRIGSSRDKMSDEAIKKFFGLEQDFMRLTGYLDEYLDASNPVELLKNVNTIPSRSEEFINRPLVTSKKDFYDTPFTVEWDFLDHNIVRFDGRFYALYKYAGPVDLVSLKAKDKLGHLLSSDDLDVVKSAIMKHENLIKKIYRGVITKFYN